jgi:hypothetical protein
MWNSGYWHDISVPFSTNVSWSEYERCKTHGRTFIRDDRGKDCALETGTVLLCLDGFQPALFNYPYGALPLYGLLPLQLVPFI